jgi:hypothetical protein
MYLRIRSTPIDGRYPCMLCASAPQRTRSALHHNTRVTNMDIFLMVDRFVPIFGEYWRSKQPIRLPERHHQPPSVYSSGVYQLDLKFARTATENNQGSWPSRALNKFIGPRRRQHTEDIHIRTFERSRLRMQNLTIIRYVDGRDRHGSERGHPRVWHLRTVRRYI